MQWPDDVLERELVGDGLLVAGIDEVGRGAWAGPASVGVAVFRDDEPAPEGICDSKALAEDQREEIFPGSPRGVASGRSGTPTPRSAIGSG